MDRHKARTKKPSGQAVAWRGIILNLVRALCAVPREPWRAWWHELCMKGIERLDPDEMLVFMVLNNLPTGAELAEHKRQEARPQLHMISRKQRSSREFPDDVETREPSKTR